MLSRAVADTDNVCIVHYIDVAMHLTPSKMSEAVQQEIDRIEVTSSQIQMCVAYDAIVMLYGLCSNGISGIRARKTPIVIPRIDDCTALFLGSQERYDTIFARYGGRLYWLNDSWVELGQIPDESYVRAYYDRLCEKFDSQTADYIVKTEFGALDGYTELVYITDRERKGRNVDVAAKLAEERRWNFHREAGSRELLEAAVNGRWDEERFLIMPQETRLEVTNDEHKMRAVPIETE